MIEMEGKSAELLRGVFERSFTLIDVAKGGPFVPKDCWQAILRNPLYMYTISHPSSLYPADQRSPSCKHSIAPQGAGPGAPASQWSLVSGDPMQLD